MKRTITAFAAAAGVAALLWADPLAAENGEPPHRHDGSHPHHVHNSSGCHDIAAPNMAGYPGGGTHRAAVNNGMDNDGMHHGPCSTHAGYGG